MDEQMARVGVPQPKAVQNVGNFHKIALESVYIATSLLHVTAYAQIVYTQSCAGLDVVPPASRACSDRKCMRVHSQS